MKQISERLPVIFYPNVRATVIIINLDLVTILADSSFIT